MKIEMGKKYKTRDGRKVRLYAVDCGGTYSVHGAIANGDVKSVTSWDACGRHNNLGNICETGRNNLVEVKEDFKLATKEEALEYFSGVRMTKAKKRIIEQYVSGLRIKDISNDSGWSVGSISQMISRDTFGLREKRIESIEARKINIFNSYKAGKISIKEISNKTGLSTPATYTMLSRVRKKIK